ncbi:MAG: hypothetical protein A2201_07285 [Alicyclobacillus sp. RIFOXYA1_FULL_53_8]|nr:MAG: hypothetical protein A2201_07285 [Alicyclobacillus sp. RIFOXYA1_FULL_53_8]
MSDYLSLFKHRNFTLMTVADAVSVLGDQIGWVALLWFAMITTGHAGTMGALALAFGLPGVLLGAVVGNILDRTSHKKILVAANLLLGAVFMTIPLLYQMYALPLPVLFVLVVIAGCLTPFTSVGWMVIVPKLVAEDSLGLANSVVETIWNGASLLGPLAGGLLIAKFGAPMAVLADGLSFWLAALCVWLIKEDRMDKARSSAGSAEGAAQPRASFLQATWHGFKVLYGLKAVWWITLGAVFINLAYGQLEVSLPLFTHNELSRSAVILGSFWTTYFISSLIGSALSGLLGKNQRTGMLMALMVIAWGFSFVPMIWFHRLWVTYVLLALAGLFFSGFPALARTAVQRLVPREYQGRVLGIRGSMIALGVPMGSYLSGTLGVWMAPSSVIGLTGFFVVFVGFGLLSVRSFRSI